MDDPGTVERSKGFGWTLTLRDCRGLSTDIAKGDARNAISAAAEKCGVGDGAFVGRRAAIGMDVGREAECRAS